jgi:hypothetical protein
VCQHSQQRRRQSGGRQRAQENDGPPTHAGSMPPKALKASIPDLP